jgi:hypothetical protein
MGRRSCRRRYHRWFDNCRRMVVVVMVVMVVMVMPFMRLATSNLAELFFTQLLQNDTLGDGCPLEY